MPRYVKGGIEHTFRQYNSTKGNPIDGVVDFIQSTFECCGVDGKNYWRQRPQFAKSLPLSCCFKPIELQSHGSCEDPSQPYTSTAWSNGCTQVIDSLLRQYITAIAGIMIFAGAIKIIAACFACSLANAVAY